jgi:hypothetical protein
MMDPQVIFKKDTNFLPWLPFPILPFLVWALLFGGGFFVARRLR